MAKFCLVMIEHFSEQFGNYQISIIFCIISFQEFLKCRLKNRILMIKFEVLYLNNCFVVIVNNNVKIEFYLDISSTGPCIINHLLILQLQIPSCI